MNEPTKELSLSTFLSVTNLATPPGFCAVDDSASVSYSDVQCKLSGRLLRNMCYAIWSVTVGPAKAWWLFNHWNIGPDKGMMNDVVEIVVAAHSSSGHFTERPYRPEASTSSPQGHVCEMHRLVPSRRPIATPQAEIGRACNQSHLLLLLFIISIVLVSA